MVSTRRFASGLTLFELLLTLAVAAVVLFVGVPSFNDLAARQRQSAELMALFHAVHVARKESIMRRRVVSLCPSADGHRCQPGRDWSAGWILFENTDRDEPPQADPGEPLLSVHRVDSRVRLTANRQGFTLRSTWLRATNGTLVACDPAGRIPPKALVVSYTGRPRVARENSRGQAYQCAD